ncbi:MAG: chlorite dismutase family protein [Thermodesulfobacteriota bacterium]|nr:chlorite dismutase family protein [Thermodesulfobacteriota bacterium]|tara:strand:- start:963 stop:1658 length:696 start_codon:yes stop_codon:yes gene_type:complete
MRKPSGRQYINYTFYKFLPQWYEIKKKEKSALLRKIERILNKYEKKITLNFYSTYGVRPETDFMFWRVSERLEDFEDMTSELMASGLGAFVQNKYSFLSMTKHSQYVSKNKKIEQEGTRIKISPKKRKYLIVYPFIKKVEWYLSSKKKRQDMMTEHIATGHKYPSVSINTSYSFGIDDQEQMVSFETDFPEDFLDLVEEMRSQKARAFTEKDTPIITCIRKNLKDLTRLFY